jgi:uroporphyrinogen decarboxylase
MNRRDRLDAAVKGLPTDRVPVSAWGHFYVDELGADTFADRMLSFREAYDWDVLKVHARASYHVEPFGLKFAPSRDPGRGHQSLHTPIRTPQDWFSLRPAPLKNPAFEEQLKGLELIRRRLPNDVPLIMTVFTPLDVADKMLDRQAETLATHIETAPEAVAYALSVFAETLEPFVRKLAGLDVDGIFLSTKWVNGARIHPHTAGWQCRMICT